MANDPQRQQRAEEWGRATDPRRLLELYWLTLEPTQPGEWSAATAHTFRLAAAACCRALWPLLEDSPEARRAVEVAEAAANGAADDLELYEAGEALRRSRVEEQGMCWYDDPYAVGLVCGPLDYAQFAAFEATESNPEVAALQAAHWARRCFLKDREIASQRAVLVQQLRDLLGNPYGPDPPERDRDSH